jgi:hypothetical protein
VLRSISTLRIGMADKRRIEYILGIMENDETRIDKGKKFQLEI